MVVLLMVVPLVVLVAAAGPSWASEFDVIINEIHYNPMSGVDADEFIELYNRGGTEVDLSNWALAEGVHLVIPTGTILAPKAYLLVSPNAARARTRYGADAVIGDYSGRLDNAGEIVTLYNASSAIISRIHYRDGGVWPNRADGLGPSLELSDAFTQPWLPRYWYASRFVDGSPGARNSVAVERQPSGSGEDIVLIASDAEWRYLKGTAAYPNGWREPGFNDASWLRGPTGIGFSDDDDRTVLTDMLNNYISIAARRTFTLTEEQLEALGEIFLLVDYDDGFVAYLNGQEAARAELGQPGSAVDVDQAADPGGHEAGTPETFSILREHLVAGVNVLAVQVHNAALNSGDLSFIPQLIGRPAAIPTEVFGDELPLVINEIKPSENGSPGFIEIYNRSGVEIPVGGFQIIDSLGNRAGIAANSRIPGRGRLLVTEGQLGFATRLAATTYVLLDDEGAFVDGINPSPGLPGENGFSFGRVPDGDNDGFVMTSPTPNAANQVTRSSAVVVNEIYFNPPFVAPSAECAADCSDRDQWIELHNQSDAEVDLSGWGLTNGILYAFDAGTRIPAGAYLVVAADRARFLVTHPGVPAARVVGGWQRALSHDSDTINLRDRLDNLVDHVEYGDGGPQNDEEPADGVDDRTFRGSEWPSGADGSGSTLELIHPALDNRLGIAWAAGPAGGTPGAVNARFDATPPPSIGDVEHSPPVPRSNQDIVVTCRAAASGAITAVRALWRRDNGAGSGTATLRDDGVSNDGLAGDGRFGGIIPRQADGAIIAFQLEVEAGGQTTRIPAAPAVAPYQGFDGPYFLLQVIDAAPPVNPSPTFYIIMTDEDRLELEDRDLFSDVRLPATIVAVPGASGRFTPVVRHLAGIRYRGAQTRNVTPRPYHLEFAPERPFLGLEEANLNSAEIQDDLLTSDLFQRAGLPAPLEWTVNLYFRGALSTRYVYKEHLDKQFLNRYYGDASDEGNLYRAFDPNNGQTPFQGDLTYRGENPDSYRVYYGKRTNSQADDYADIIELCRVFDRQQTPDDVFPERLEAIVDVWQWARFFAAQACISNSDGGIQTGTGEDYFLYKVNADSSRADAGKWVLIPWDLEESYNSATERLFRPDIAAIRRFLTHQRYAPYYYCHLRELREGAYSRRETRQRFRLIDFLFAFATIDGIDAFITARLGFFDINVPATLSSGASDGTTGIGANRLVAVGDLWSYFKGTSEPSGGTRAWTQLGFDDSSWDEGPSGFGYGDGDDATILNDMVDNYSSVYARRVFAVQNPAAIPVLNLSIDFDDGFVAYLNGVEVARRDIAGAPNSAVAFDDLASGANEAGTPVAIDISAFADELRAGDNVLAIHGLNRTLDSSDFSLIPELLASAAQLEGSVGCGTLVYTTDAAVGLSGRSNACDTRAVRINGQPGSYDTVLAQWAGIAPVALGANTITVEALDGAGRVIDTLRVAVQRLAGGFQEIAGTLNRDTTWSSANGPYSMSGTVTVPAGITLTIEPGTLIFADAGAAIIVRGRIEAAGTEAAPIRIAASNCAGFWGGIALDGTGVAAASPTQTFRYCHFESGNAPSGFGGFIGGIDSKILVDNCEFARLGANAVDGVRCRLEVRSSLFEEIQEGVHGTNSTVIVENCHFNGMIGDKDAIDFDGNGTERSRIAGNLIENGSDDGIDLADTTVDIHDNVLINVEDKALSLETNGPLGAPTIVGNVIFNCGTGIALKDGVTIQDGHHNTVVGNQEGINLFAKAGAPDGGHGVFHSMIIWDNAFDVKLDGLSSVAFTNSNISGGDVWPGNGNISQDPRFVSVHNANFTLRPASPCIGTGKDGSDMGAFPFEGTLETFLRGDVDGSGAINLTDVLRILDFLFRDGAAPSCHDRMDANDDGFIDVSDGVFELLYLFKEGSPPPEPFPASGLDPTPDGVPCGGAG
jgi:hypothetical protein